MQVQFTAKRPMKWVRPNHRGRLHTFLPRTCSPQEPREVHGIHSSEALLVHFICKSAAACSSGCTYPFPKPCMNTFVVLASLVMIGLAEFTSFEISKGPCFVLRTVMQLPEFDPAKGT